MKNFRIILFFFLFSNIFLGFERNLKEDYGSINLNFKLSDEEIKQLKEGKRTSDFIYFQNPDSPALTTYPFYIAVPENFEIYFSENSSYETGKIPVLDLEGRLVYTDYELPDNWFPEKPVLKIQNGLLRQVPFALFQFYPIQISKNGLKINKEIQIQIKYNPKNLSKIEEKTIFSDLYDELFLNKWEDKGVPTKNLRNINFWSIPPSNYTIYKIPIDEDGIYALDYDFLDTNTDWNLAAVDPRKIHLYNLGQEIPIYITGESDGHFDIGDVLYFYGEKYKDENLEDVWQKGDFTDRNIYWLVVEETNGGRMATRDVSPQSNYPILQNYEYKIHFEENLDERPFIPEQTQDHWMWDYIKWYSFDTSHTFADFSLFLPSVSNSPSNNCKLKYEVRGISYRTQNPDHHIKIKINGNLVDEFYFDDYYFYQREVNFPQSYLGVGSQTITLTYEVPNPSEIGVDGDGSCPNWFEISYLRDFSSYNNEIFFSIPSGNHKIQITNFSSNNIILLDTTNPKNPVFCINYTLNSGTLTFEDSLSSNKSYVAQLPKTLSSLISYTQKNLLDTNPNYLIIAPKDWTTSSVLQDYLNFRQSQGLEVKLVAVEDIYDQFNYGIFSPFPIRDFLQNLYNKSNPPELTYVLIIGDAEYDYKGFKGDGNYNFVPTYMRTSTGYGNSLNPYAYYSYENFFVNFSGNDYLPEVLLGRIPAKNQTQMEDTLTKIKNYETSLPSKDYLKNFFHIADCRDGTYFKQAQNINASYVQPPYSVENMFLTDPPYNSNPPNCSDINFDQNKNGKTDVVDKMNLGEGFVNFTGHGGFWVWSDCQILRSPDDMPYLTNSDKPSVVLNSNCYTASFYHSYYTTTILEDLLVRGTGAVSAFGPGTYMFISQLTLPTEPIYKNFFGYFKERSLGILYYQSFANIASTGNERLAKGMVVLGDPATFYQAPTPAKPQNLSLSQNCRKITLSWSPPNSQSYTYNIYRSTTSNLNDFTKILSNYNGTSYDDTNIVYGNTYYYYVTAVDIDGFEGKGSDIKSIYSNPCPPNPPTNFQCSDSTWGGRINFSWDLSGEPEVIGYKIYYGFSSNNYPYYKDLGYTSNYQIGGIPDGTAVYSRLSAKNNWYESEKVEEISCISTHTNAWKPPEMVYPLILTKNGGSPVLNFNLPNKNIWGDSISPSNIQKCTIYRSGSPNFNPNRSSSSPDKIGEVLPSSCNNNNCSFTDNSSPSNAFYYVTCETPQKEESSVSIPPPSYPTNLTSQKIRGKYYLNWEIVNKDMEGNPTNVLYYEIYRSTNQNFLPDFKDKTNKIYETTSNSYTDTPPDSNTYYYKVLAVDQKGNPSPY